MIDLVEYLLPRVVQKLYEAGVARELVSRSLNGLVSAMGVLAAVAFFLFVFRRQLRGVLERVNGLKFFTVVLTALTFLSLPDPVFPMRPGLDYSWQWMLNRLAFGNDWGESIVFTYGPLGWVVCPYGRWATVLSALAANIVFCVLWIWSVRRIYLSSEGGRAMAWGLVLTMFFPQQSMEWRWIVLAIVLTRASWLAAGAVAAFLAMMKFSSVVMALGTQVFLLVADKRRKITRYVAGFAVMFALLVSVSFPSPAAFWKWLTGSIQIASGYNQYMLVDKNVVQLLSPILAFLVLVHRPRFLVTLLPVSPLLYCAAKYCWVRQGVGPFLYVLTVAAALLMERFADCRRRFTVLSVLFVLVGYGLVWPWHFASGMTYVAFPYGIHPMGLVRSLALPVSMSAVAARTKALVAGSKLPEDIRKSIGDATVQLLGHEFSPAMADSTLKIMPYATMQMYSTYTANLDKMAAASYSKANAPVFILIDTENLSIDSKNAFIDCPRTWAAIKANYSLCEKTKDGRWFLLKRRLSPITISYARKVDVADATLFEKLVSLFFRGRMQFAELEMADGTKQSIRVNPLVLDEPVDRELPLALKDLAGYFPEKAR